MLINSKALQGLAVRATDGKLGTVDELYFDDQTWAIRYLTLETGGWLGGRAVLVSPFAILGIDWEENQLRVALSKDEVEHSPNIDTHMPVSRQHEANYLDYYGYPHYWGGPYLWGPELYPTEVPMPVSSGRRSRANPKQEDAKDSHLRSTHAITGYHIDGTDGEIGHVEGFLVDEKAWAIRYIEVATLNWWPGKKVLIPSNWIERVSWIDAKLYVGLTRDAIKSAPEYFESASITREYEDGLHRHYVRPPYWSNEPASETAHSLSSV